MVRGSVRDQNRQARSTARDVMVGADAVLPPLPPLLLLRSWAFVPASVGGYLDSWLWQPRVCSIVDEVEGEDIRSAVTWCQGEAHRARNASAPSVVCGGVVNACHLRHQAAVYCRCTARRLAARRLLHNIPSPTPSGMAFSTTLPSAGGVSRVLNGVSMGALSPPPRPRRLRCHSAIGMRFVRSLHAPLSRMPDERPKAQRDALRHLSSRYRGLVPQASCSPPLCSLSFLTRSHRALQQRKRSAACSKHSATAQAWRTNHAATAQPTALYCAD